MTVLELINLLEQYDETLPVKIDNTVTNRQYDLKESNISEFLSTVWIDA